MLSREQQGEVSPDAPELPTAQAVFEGVFGDRSPETISGELLARDGKPEW